MKSLQAGDVLEVVATDPGTQKDIPSWCDRTGNELLSSLEESNIFKYYVKKSK
ncbi:MAG: sulfurtransferase TusA family protein [Planctomycetota bacterium]